MAANRLLNVLGLFREQLSTFANPARDAGWTAAEDQAFQFGRSVQHVLHGQHAAPGAAEKVQALEMESFPHASQLLYKALDSPERIVSGPLGIPATKLVVEDDLTPGGETLQLLEIEMRKARAAVQAKHGDSTFANSAIPDPTTRNVDVAFFSH